MNCFDLHRINFNIISPNCIIVENFATHILFRGLLFIIITKLEQLKLKLKMAFSYQVMFQVIVISALLQVKTLFTNVSRQYIFTTL